MGGAECERLTMKKVIDVVACIALMLHVVIVGIIGLSGLELPPPPATRVLWLSVLGVFSISWAFTRLMMKRWE